MTRDRRLFIGDPEYPGRLSQIPDPPKSLYVRGTEMDHDLPTVGIVGSRNPNPYGRYMARTISGGLAASGVIVVSGFARGIDSEAHTGVLEKNGFTVAVLGCGLDVDYPRGSRKLAGKIASRGALITEFEPGTPPLPHHFPARNRIISGLSLAVVVVQAGLKSGSLITARWALDQGRDVFAVPGRADDPLSAGPISLIRDGAAPVCGAADILEVLGLKPHGRENNHNDTDGDEKSCVLRTLGQGPRLPEELVRACDTTLPRILSELTELEIKGVVGQDPGGRFYLL